MNLVQFTSTASRADRKQWNSPPGARGTIAVPTSSWWAPARQSGTYRGDNRATFFFLLRNSLNSEGIPPVHHVRSLWIDRAVMFRLLVTSTWITYISWAGFYRWNIKVPNVKFVFFLCYFQMFGDLDFVQCHKGVDWIGIFSHWQ